MAIYTPRGDCGSVRVAARIVGGRVYSKDESYQSNGVVSASGVIRVSVAAGGQQAFGVGRLSRTLGSGTWQGQGSAGFCAGIWQAERRG